MIRALAVANVRSLDPEVHDAVVTLPSGETVPFREMYDLYRPRIYRYLLSYARTAEDAADLTQAVFVRALQGLPSFQARAGGFNAWIFRIARNVATDAHRRRHYSLPWEHVPEYLHPLSDEEPETLALRREDLRRLKVLVDSLDARKREMLSLRFAGKLSAGEIAAVVGGSEAAVQKQLWRTVQWLKEHFDATEV